MPKAYEECKKSELAKGKSLKDAKRICAISYFKRTGRTPMQDEGKAGEASVTFDQDEIELFQVIETLGKIIFSQKSENLDKWVEK